MGWPTQSLEAVAALVRGVSFDKSEVTAEPGDGRLPILRAGNISDVLDTRSDLIWVPSTRVRPDQRLRPGDIAICMSSGSQAVVGKSAPLREDWSGSVGAFCAIVRPEQARIDPEFLALYMRSEAFRAWTRRSEGANIKNIRHSELLDVRIPVPPMDQQRRAVDLLSRAENIVRMRREAEQKAKEIIPALFLDMFGDPARNAKGWEKKTIGDLCSYSRYGPRFPDREYLPGGAHILRTTDMDDFGAVRWWEAPKLPMESAELEKYALKAPTLLVTRSGTIGRVALFNGSDEPCIAGAYLIELGLKAGVSPEYVLHFFLSECGQKVLIGGARGVTQVNLNAPTIMAIHIPMPPPSLQEQFVRRAAQLQALSDVQKRATLVATASFEALVAGVFQQ
jgi:type I restriction enzyme S subunit